MPEPPETVPYPTPRVGGWLPPRGRPYTLKCGFTVYIDWGFVRPRGTSRRSRTHKLTPDDVREIRRLYDTGEYTQTALADMYGCSGGTVYKIVHRKSWIQV